MASGATHPSTVSVHHYRRGENCKPSFVLLLKVNWSTFPFKRFEVRSGCGGLKQGSLSTLNPHPLISASPLSGGFASLSLHTLPAWLHHADGGLELVLCDVTIPIPHTLSLPPDLCSVEAKKEPCHDEAGKPVQLQQEYNARSKNARPRRKGMPSYSRAVHLLNPAEKHTFFVRAQHWVGVLVGTLAPTD